MNNNEELVTNVTENAEELTAEEVVGNSTGEKVYTEEEFNRKLDEVLPGKIKRVEKKLRREYEDKYNDYLTFENVIKAGTGIETDNVKDLTEQMASFYRNNNIEIPSFERNYSEDDLKILANVDAEEIISGGYDDINDELNRLSAKGLEGMTPKEKLIFTKLDKEFKKIEEEKYFSSIGLSNDDMKEYREFASQLDPNLTSEEKYKIYTKYRPQPKVEPIGSMKGTKSKDEAIKDFYTYDEAIKFTKEDFDKNPKLYEAVKNSMTKWK